MVQQVKDLVVSLQWLRSLLWCRFDSWPRNFFMLQVQPKGNKKYRSGDAVLRTAKMLVGGQ